MKTTPPLLLMLALGALVAACATTEPGASRRSRDAITQEDVQSVRGAASNAYQVVKNLRPQWLQKRSGGVSLNQRQEEMEGDIVVYVNGARAGGPETLRSIAINSIQEIRYLGAAEAARYGTGHQHGALLVQTR